MSEAVISPDHTNTVVLLKVHNILAVKMSRSIQLALLCVLLPQFGKSQCTCDGK